MNNILLQVKSAHGTGPALEYVTRSKNCGPSRIHLLNVQRPILSGEITYYHTANMILHARQAMGQEILRPVRELLEAEGMDHTIGVVLGDPARSIAQYAAANTCNVYTRHEFNR